MLFLDTLEEWKLVFYGTDTSVEVDDELDKDKPLPPVVQEEVNNAPSDVRHNAVDTEGDPWTGSRQMNRVSHPEVQRPTTENQTSGCAAFEAGGNGCLGGCLILLLLAYLTSVPGWRELIISWPASNSRSELGAEADRLLIAVTNVVPTTTATSWISDATTQRVPAVQRAPEACRCSWWQRVAFDPATARDPILWLRVIRILSTRVAARIFMTCAWRALVIREILIHLWCARGRWCRA